MNFIKPKPEKEILFNRCFYGEMDKKKLTELMKRLQLKKELREWFTVQIKFIVLFRDSRQSAQ